MKVTNCKSLFREFSGDIIAKEGVISGEFNKKIYFCEGKSDFNMTKETHEYKEGVFIFTLPKETGQYDKRKI